MTDLSGLPAELEKLKNISRQLELFRADLDGYGEFIERNITQAKRIVQLEKAIGELRDELYDALPTGEVHAFDLIKLIKEHITKMDSLLGEG